MTRSVSPHLGRCQLTHLARQPIDVDLAVRQHDAYCAALSRLGCAVQTLPPDPDLPDGVFVEDPAVVLDEVAIIARSSANTRRDETPSVEAALRPYRDIEHIAAPATLDGGDVLRLDRRVFVGLSPRTNEVAMNQLREILGPHGYTVQGVKVTGCLHLKSACTAVTGDLLVANREWFDADAIGDVQWLDVDPDEPRGANHLYIDGAVLSPMSCPRTVERIRAEGISVEVVDVSQLELAESGVTCSSLIFDITDSS